jgi:hypothetical protein
MSKSVAIASGKGPGEREPVSVFDFLYHDSRRVGSFLAQLDANGLLTEVRHSEHVAKGRKRGVSVNLGASTPLTGGGNVGFEITPKEAGGETLERVYDPYWANARELLDSLTANDLVGGDLEAAGIGSLVHVSGALSIIDLGMLKDAWGLDAVRRTALAGGTAEQVEPMNRHDRRSQTAQKLKSKDSPPTENELMLEILKILPHSLSAMLNGSHGSVWCGLSEQYLVGSGSDLVLKHGHRIAGEWHMVGVLDAQPDITALAGAFDAENEILNGDGAILFNSLIGNVARNLAPTFRLMVGRPVNSYGITPLMIFRKVA